MIIYCNNECSFEIEDNEPEIYYDIYIYTPDGIYKKYKYHFYEIDINENITSYFFNEKDYFVKENQDIMNKNKIITTIPYKHYFVNRKIMKLQISDTITYVKELDNDIYSRHYFITDIPLYDAFEEISSFYNNKLSI